MIIIIISFIDNLALFYLSLDGTLFPDVVSYLWLSADHSHIEDLTDGPGSCGEQRRSRGTIRTPRMVFRATGNLHERVSNQGNDGRHHADPGGGS